MRAPSLGLLVRTLSQYEPGQLLNYAVRRISRRRPVLRPAPALRSRRGSYVPGIVRPYPEVRPGVFRLLNVEHAMASARDWPAPDVPKLWLYTLHYHEALSAGPEHSTQQQALIRRWIDENPPAAGVGWDPYPISLRCVQWIKWLVRGESAVPGMLESLAMQLRYLARTLETHLGANHLFSNATALVAGGLFFDDAEADRWRDCGLAILKREVPKQFHADGGHFELSPSYHGLLLESILDLENLVIAYGWGGPKPWAGALPRARRWLAAMTRPDGGYPQFNDCAQSAAPPPAAIERYARAIGLPAVEALAEHFIDLADTGYARYQRSRYTAFVDAGRFAPRTQPGHGHCDMLSFELSVGGRLVITNGGTSTYERSPLRQTERSTSAHNTVQLDGAEQTEIWSAFRAGRKARIVEREAGPDMLRAAHDGFRPLRALHRRTFRFHNDRIAIADEIVGEGAKLPAVARIHFVPGIVPTIDGDNVTAGPLRIATDGAADRRIADFAYAADFNRRLPAKVLETTFVGSFNTEIIVR